MSRGYRNTAAKYGAKSPASKAGGHVRGFGMGYPAPEAVSGAAPQSANPQYAAPQHAAQRSPYEQARPQAPAQPLTAAERRALKNYEKQFKKRRNAGFWVAVAFGVICVVLIVLLAFVMLGGNQKSTRSGQVGQLEGKTPEEVQAELDRVVEEGMFNISIASTVELENGTAPADIRVENVPGNHYLMRVEVTDDATGQTVYTTDFIEPNHHIQTDTLDVDLDAGTYECTATFFAYDQETEDEVGQAAAKMTIRVLN